MVPKFYSAWQCFNESFVRQRHIRQVECWWTKITGGVGQVVRVPRHCITNCWGVRTNVRFCCAGMNRENHVEVHCKYYLKFIGLCRILGISCNMQAMLLLNLYSKQDFSKLIQDIVNVTLRLKITLASSYDLIVWCSYRDVIAHVNITTFIPVVKLWLYWCS